MRASGRASLAVSLVIAVAVAAKSFATNLPSVTYVDRSDGYEITLPSAWKLLPRSAAGVRAEITALTKSKQAGGPELASALTAILASSAGRTGLTAYRLQALAWPIEAGTPLLTQVSVGVVTIPKPYGKGSLAPLGDEYANALSANAGSKILVPRTVELPAGRAEFIEGTIPAGGGLANGIELYLIPHGKRVYELSFQIDARGLREATLFTAIAKRFAFV